MPTYEYACPACGNRYEKRESFSAPARQKCPSCGKTAARVLHAPPIVFKGSGFYATDARGKNGASSVSDESPSSDKKAEAPATTAASEDSTSDAAAAS